MDKIIIYYLLQYFTISLGFIKRVRMMEPMNKKFRRWFLGEDNVTPDSLKDIIYCHNDIKLKPESIRLLSEIFIETDRKFAYGVNRKMIAKLLKRVGSL